MNILKTYQFKLRPNTTQIVKFEQWIGVCRLIYNMALDIKKDAYRINGTSLSKNDLQKQIVEIRDEYKWIKEVHSQVLQDVTDRLFRAYDAFFKRVKIKAKKKGFPKFAKKNKYASFGFKQGIKLLENSNKIFLPKIGKVKFIKDRNIEGKVKLARIIKKADGYYISLTVEQEHIPMPSTGVITGLDLGLTSLVTTSSGKVPNPKFIYKYEGKLKIAQRSVSRKQKGSENRKKAVYKLQILHKKVSDTRKDFLHKLSTELISENQVIGIESLNIQNMVKNHNLAKAIHDAGWGMFIGMLKYKAVWNEREIIEADTYFPSTKMCNVCKYVNRNLTLSDREWVCPICGTKHDRDENSEVNLNIMAVGQTVSACGASFERKKDIVAPLG